jgi:hypothetical protein
MDSRIYVVKDGDSMSLVEATSGAQALRFIAKAKYSVEVASPKMIAALMAKGNQVMDATKAEEAEQSVLRG